LISGEDSVAKPVKNVPDPNFFTCANREGRRRINKAQRVGERLMISTARLRIAIPPALFKPLAPLIFYVKFHMSGHAHFRGIFATTSAEMTFPPTA
jgi:hypothetical protein